MHLVAPRIEEHQEGTTASPEYCGSTSPSTSWAATAASTALPPSFSISTAAADARGIGGRHHVARRLLAFRAAGKSNDEELEGCDNGSTGGHLGFLDWAPRSLAKGIRC